MRVGDAHIEPRTESLPELFILVLKYDMWLTSSRLSKIINFYVLPYTVKT